MYYTYGYVPKRFARGLVLPLLKKLNLDINAASSYGPINIAPIISKLIVSCLPVLDPFCTSHANYLVLLQMVAPTRLSLLCSLLLITLIIEVQMFMYVF